MYPNVHTQTRSGLSLQKRRDDTYGYVYTTSSGVEGDRLAADVAHDTNKPGTVYALVYDEQGYDSVVEITSIADADNTAPGWGDTGPSRPGKTDQPFPMYPDDDLGVEPGQTVTPQVVLTKVIQVVSPCMAGIPSNRLLMDGLGRVDIAHSL